MRTRNVMHHDDGLWEFSYEERTTVVVDPTTGEPELTEDGRRKLVTEVHDVRFRPEGSDGEWQTLPPWADVRDDWKINLCWFDEDEETQELTYWTVHPTIPQEEVATA